MTLKSNPFCQDEKLKTLKDKILPLLSGLTYEETIELFEGLRCDIRINSIFKIED